MHLTVVPLFGKSRESGERPVGTMFQNEQPVGPQLSLACNKRWYGFKQGMVIGRIRENEVERVHLLAEEIKGIGFNKPNALYIK